MTRTTTARVAPAPGPAAPPATGPAVVDAAPEPGTDRPSATPTLAGEVRGTALLFALALTVTVGAAAVARAFPGLTP